MGQGEVWKNQLISQQQNGYQVDISFVTGYRSDLRGKFEDLSVQWILRCIIWLHTRKFVRKISRYRKFIQIARSLCETTLNVYFEGQAPYYTQCVADPTTYSTLPGCISNYGAKCSSTTSCCDPGAYCDLTKGITQCWIVFFTAVDRKYIFS